jgi:hypothetical protein
VTREPTRSRLLASPYPSYRVGEDQVLRAVQIRRQLRPGAVGRIAAAACVHAALAAEIKADRTGANRGQLTKVFLWIVFEPVVVNLVVLGYRDNIPVSPLRRMVLFRMVASLPISCQIPMAP